MIPGSRDVLKRLGAGEAIDSVCRDDGMVAFRVRCLVAA